MSLGSVPRSGVAGPCGPSVFNLPETARLSSTVAAPFYIPTHLARGVPVSPHTCQNLLFFISGSVTCHCVSLMEANDTEHPFTCVLAICVCSLGKCIPDFLLIFPVRWSFYH